MNTAHNPVERFCAIHDALQSDRTWTEDANCLRHAALTLTNSSGSPQDVARRLRHTADELKSSSKWYSALRSNIRFALAGLLVGADETPRAFCNEVTRVRDIWRACGLRHTEPYDTLAIWILWQNSSDRYVTRAEVERLKQLHTLLRKDHPWLTGADDYPACALLSSKSSGDSSARSLTAISERVERLYQGLRRKGFSRGNQLQMAAHIMSLHPAHDEAGSTRFARIFKQFKRAGLRMHAGDYDECAILSLLDCPETEVVRQVVDDRRLISALKPSPSKETHFSLACGTAFLKLAPSGDSWKTVGHVKTLVEVQALIQAQQAAIMAAASSTVVVTG